MERGRYTGYRGRKGKRNLLSVFGSVLAVLVVLIVLLLVLCQQYIYYGADGVHLDLPFLKREPAPVPNVDNVVVEIVPSTPSST